MKRDAETAPQDPESEQAVNQFIRGKPDCYPVVRAEDPRQLALRMAVRVYGISNTMKRTQILDSAGFFLAWLEGQEGGNE